MAYRARWRAEIAALKRILSGFELREECQAVAAAKAGRKVETTPRELPYPRS